MKSKGFTILEIIIAVSVFSVLMFVAAALLITILQNPQLQISALNSIDQARLVASNFTNEIRAAAYGTYPLVEAADSEIIFYSPIGAVAGSVNRIRYYSSGGILYKGVIAPVDGVYNPASEVVAGVLSGLSNGAVPLFYYYNGDYDGAPDGQPLSAPVNINDVRFVEINLIVQNQEVQSGTSTFSLKAGAAIRILKSNLIN